MEIVVERLVAVDGPRCAGCRLTERAIMVTIGGSALGSLNKGNHQLFLTWAQARELKDLLRNQIADVEDDEDL